MNLPFIWLVVSAAIGCSACTTTTPKPYSTGSAASDTTFLISARQIKSSKIPDSIFEMKHLRHLSISGMDCDGSFRGDCWMIDELPVKIRKLQELKSLSLTLSVIREIPDELAELQHLELIDFTDASLSNTNLDILTKIRSLKYLYLYGCGLASLPADIGNLINLKEIGLVGNNFSEGERARIRNALPNCNIKF